MDEADELLAQSLRNTGNAALYNTLLELLFGKSDMKMQAAPLQRIAEIAFAVGSEDYGRRHGGGDRTEFGNADLEIGEDFQEQRFELRVRLVDLIDQQHTALR